LFCEQLLKQQFVWAAVNGSIPALWGSVTQDIESPNPWLNPLPGIFA
jgi:hypothetical protein